MKDRIIKDLELYSNKDLLQLNKHFGFGNKINIEKIAEKIISDYNKSSWNVYCDVNYIPNVIENTKEHLLKKLANNSVCNITKSLTRVGKSSSSAAVFDYHPTDNVRAVVKVVPDRQGVRKEIELMQLLSGIQYFPFVYLIQKCRNKYYIVLEHLGPTLTDLIEEKVSPRTIKKVIRETLEAIKMMTANGIIHTDLKSDNIMLRCTGKNSYQTVIIDFDLVNNPNRDLKEHIPFDVYDFMRRLHDMSSLETNFPTIHQQVTQVYLNFKADKYHNRSVDFFLNQF